MSDIEDYMSEIEKEAMAQISKEDAAWDKLSESEKEKINEDRELFLSQFSRNEDNDEEE